MNTTTTRRFGRSALLGAAVLVSGLAVIPSALASDSSHRDLVAGQSSAASMQGSAALAPQAWECGPGFVCLFDGLNGQAIRPTVKVFKGGEADLGRRTPPQNDQAESFLNRTGRWAAVYDWRDAQGFVLLGCLAPGGKDNIPGIYRNIIDKVKVNSTEPGCPLP